MEWVVYFSITCISAFLLTISIYCCLYIRRNQLQEQEQIRQIEEDREAAAAASKSIVVSYDCRVYNESDSGMGRYQSPSTSMMVDGITDPSNVQVQRSRSALSVSNQAVGGQQQVMNNPSGQIMNPSGLLITTGSGGQLVSSRNSLEGPSSSSATNELVVHSSIHKSHSSSNVNQQQLVYHQQQGQQSISGSRPRSAGSSNQQHAHHELTCSHPSQGRHHSGPSVPGISSAGARRGVQYVTVSNEAHDFHQDRNFGNMPPIGSAMAEFQNDFISVFPMNHLEPQPDLR